MNVQETDKEIKARAQASQKYDETGFWFYNGLLGVKAGGKWGFINDEGRLVIPCQFSDRPIFEGNYARAYIARHCCGLIDNKGNVIIPFEYDNVKPFDEEGFAQFETGIYWGTIDRNGIKHISPKMKFQQIGCFVNGVAPAKIDTKWGLIDTKGNKITPFQYYEIENCTNNLFYARLKPRLYGYLNPFGEPLFQLWFDWMGKFDDNGLAIFALNKKYGIAHKSGVFLFPPIYDGIQWDREENCFNAVMDGNLFVLEPSGVIRQVCYENNQLDKDFLEKVINWTLSGLTFYYRDTNSPVDVDQIYKKGRIIRAGAFIDVTTKAQKPISRLRFIVASAHTARLFEIEDICRQNPDVATWKLSTLHYNSYFKVMDVYRVGEQYQVFLLHFPYKAIPLFMNDTTFVFKVGGSSEDSLVDMARESFDSKIRMEPLQTLDEQEWINRTYIPIGLSEEDKVLSLDFAYPDLEEIVSLGNLIRKLADDTDDINDA